MILGRNKIYWFIASFLGLTIIVGLYILDGIHTEKKEEAERLRASSSLFIPAEGEFYFYRDMIRLTDLPLKMESLEKELGANYVLHIEPDKWVRFSTIIEAIKIIQGAGHNRIGLPTIYNSTRWRGIKESEIQVLAQDCVTTDSKLEIKIESTDNENALIKLNEQPILLDGLSDALRRMLGNIDDKTVYVRAITELPFCRVAEILDAARRAGAENIRLMMDKEKPVKH